MGEAKRRLDMKVLRPGEQIQIGPEVMKNAIQTLCECGCKYFQAVVTLYTVSAIISPIGKEVVAQQPALVCLECRKPWNPAEKRGADGGASDIENPKEV